MTTEALHYLARGAAYPYDAPASFWQGKTTTPLPIDWAHSAARGIMADLSDRCGIDDAINKREIAAEVRAEIVQSISDIIRAADRMRWRTMDDAPTDGRVIDVWLGDASDSDVEFYCTPGTRFSPGWRWHNDKWRPRIGDFVMPTFVQPTHWRPVMEGPL